MNFQTYNRLVKSPIRNPYVIFNGRKVPLNELKDKDFVMVGGKPYSVYFTAPIIKGLRRE